jgi:hypothetical protein
VLGLVKSDLVRTEVAVPEMGSGVVEGGKKEGRKESEQTRGTSADMNESRSAKAEESVVVVGWWVEGKEGRKEKERSAGR